MQLAAKETKRYKIQNLAVRKERVKEKISFNFQIPAGIPEFARFTFSLHKTFLIKNKISCSNY